MCVTENKHRLPRPLESRSPEPRRQHPARVSLIAGRKFVHKPKTKDNVEKSDSNKSGATPSELRTAAVVEGPGIRGLECCGHHGMSVSGGAPPVSHRGLTQVLLKLSERVHSCHFCALPSFRDRPPTSDVQMKGNQSGSVTRLKTTRPFPSVRT